MKRLVALAVAVLLSAAQISAADAAPARSAEKSRPQGLENARKVMQSKLERDKKTREVKKKGQAKRQQARGRR